MEPTELRQLGKFHKSYHFTNVFIFNKFAMVSSNEQPPKKAHLSTSEAGKNDFLFRKMRKIYFQFFLSAGFSIKLQAYSIHSACRSTEPYEIVVGIKKLNLAVVAVCMALATSNSKLNDEGEVKIK